MKALDLLLAVEQRECQRLVTWASHWMDAEEARDLAASAMGRVVHRALHESPTESGPLAEAVGIMISNMRLTHATRRAPLPPSPATSVVLPAVWEHEEMCKAYAILVALGGHLDMNYVDRLFAEAWLRRRWGFRESPVLAGLRDEVDHVAQPYLARAGVILSTAAFSTDELYGWSLVVFERELGKTHRRWPIAPPPRTGA